MSLLFVVFCNSHAGCVSGCSGKGNRSSWWVGDGKLEVKLVRGAGQVSLSLSGLEFRLKIRFYQKLIFSKLYQSTLSAAGMIPTLVTTDNDLAKYRSKFKF